MNKNEKHPIIEAISRNEKKVRKSFEKDNVGTF